MTIEGIKDDCLQNKSNDLDAEIRNAEITRLVLGGQSLAAVGRLFKLSHSRIADIVKKYCRQVDSASGRGSDIRALRAKGLLFLSADLPSKAAAVRVQKAISGTGAGLSIRQCGFPTRVVNCLLSEFGDCSVEFLLTKTDEELLRIPNFRVKSLAVIRAAIGAPRLPDRKGL